MWSDCRKIWNLKVLIRWQQQGSYDNTDMFSWKTVKLKKNYFYIKLKNKTCVKQPDKSTIQSQLTIISHSIYNHYHEFQLNCVIAHYIVDLKSLVRVLLLHIFVSKQIPIHSFCKINQYLSVYMTVSQNKEFHNTVKPLRAPL